MSDFLNKLRGVLMLLAMLAFLVGAGLGIWTFKTQRWQVTTTGTITDILSFEDHHACVPVFEFSDENGTHTVRSAWQWSEGIFKIGERVTVSYPYGLPNEARLVTWRDWRLTLICLGFAVVAWLVVKVLGLAEERLDKKADAQKAARRAARLAAKDVR